MSKTRRLAHTMENLSLLKVEMAKKRHSNEYLKNKDYNYLLETFNSSNICSFILSISVKNTFIPLVLSFINPLKLS